MYIKEPLNQGAAYTIKKGFIRLFVKKFKWFILGQLVVMQLWAVCNVARPYTEKKIIDTLTLPLSQSTVSAIWVLIFTYVGIGVFSGVIFRFSDWLSYKYIPRARENLTLFLINHLFDHGYLFFLKELSGNLSNKINDIAEGLPLLTKLIIDTLISSLFLCIWVGIVLFQINAKLCFIEICWAVLFSGIALRMSKNIRIISQAVGEKRSQLIGNITDSIANYNSIKLFASKAYEHNVIYKLLREFKKAFRERDFIAIKINILQSIVFTLLQLSSISYLYYAYQKKEVNVGDFALVFGVNNVIFASLWSLAANYNECNARLGILIQALNTILLPHEIQDKVQALPLTVKKGAIEFKDINFKYPDSNFKLSNINIHIPAGRKIGIVGCSGSGKSTLTNLLLRMFEPNSGNIYIDEQDINLVTQDSLRKAISVIPQDLNLFHRSILENISYGKPDANYSEVVEATKRAHAHDFILTLEKSYETLIGERGVILSGGQKQRIAIARALLKNAPIVVIDEATSNLDSITELLIQESISSLFDGKTILVIAHRLSTLLHMDELIVLSEGKIIQQGSHDTLVRQTGMYKRLWESQIAGFLPGYLNNKSSN